MAKPDVASILYASCMLSSLGIGQIFWLFHNALSSAEIV
jgi:hypothetical protein